jgi:hypothetical protein
VPIIINVPNTSTDTGTWRLANPVIENIRLPMLSNLDSLSREKKNRNRNNNSFQCCHKAIKIVFGQTAEIFGADKAEFLSVQEFGHNPHFP